MAEQLDRGIVIKPFNDNLINPYKIIKKPRIQESNRVCKL
jgi:hypothetical protein